MADPSDTSPLVPPSPITDPNEIDLEAGPGEQIQCRICLETDGRDFIAPCKCKGTSKYVHRECLDHWRAVREGFAFAHCTTCKAPYHLRVHVAADRKWRTLKFRFFVTRDIMFIFLTVQLVIASLAYLVYLIDGYQQSWIRRAWGFDSEELYCFLLCLDYLGASLLVMIEECAMIWPSLAENYVFVAVILASVPTVIYPALFVCGLTVPHALRAVLVWQCIGGHNGRTTNLAASLSHTCKKDANKKEQPMRWDSKILTDLHVLALDSAPLDFAHFRLALLVCSPAYLVIDKPPFDCDPNGPLQDYMARKDFHGFPHCVNNALSSSVVYVNKYVDCRNEYVVEDVDGETSGSDWSPPPLPPEHVQQLRSLGLL
ncbi:hypothetical protein TIFTF001_004236 [Ficus carica]|uniref:RING-CH-type domain-containing protein n=1 Tax=Ficus carica TaxID=3494 RepID=A0AA88CSW2_FICCA|nr:hypothetical protein TIFTF001_004236 [Ficus carica]